jgi:hypothetical protein
LRKLGRNFNCEGEEGRRWLKAVALAEADAGDRSVEVSKVLMIAHLISGSERLCSAGSKAGNPPLTTLSPPPILQKGSAFSTLR